MALWRDERARNGGLDEIPLPVGPGRLWLCGKHLVGPDVEAVLERTGATAVVCLNERHELERRYPRYVAWLEENGPGGRAVWFPIPDLHVPEADAIRAFVAELAGRLAAGDGLVVHCGAGMGRAGTVAAAVLIAQGCSVAEALTVVAIARPGAGPQAQVQEDLLDALAAGA
ncbi:MAG TPA: hypothetical protein VJ804_10145 [Acidimicrobiales bacterium]|nr:hypothetical protein [Acidimicrobiales bacterium]